MRGSGCLYGGCIPIVRGGTDRSRVSVQCIIMPVWACLVPGQSSRSVLSSRIVFFPHAMHSVLCLALAISSILNKSSLRRHRCPGYVCVFPLRFSLNGDSAADLSLFSCIVVRFFIATYGKQERGRGLVGPSPDCHAAWSHTMLSDLRCFMSPYRGVCLSRYTGRYRSVGRRAQISGIVLLRCRMMHNRHGRLN